MKRHVLFLPYRRLLISLKRSASVQTVTHFGRSASTPAAVREPRDPSRTEQSENLKPFSAIPGPKPLPVLRNLLEFKRNSNRINQFFGECYNKYGEIFKLEAPGGRNFVYMADPHCLENILRAEGKYPRRDNHISPNAEWLLTELGYPVSLAFQSGEDWKKGRSAINKQIKPSSVQAYTPGLNGIASRFTDYLKNVRDENKRISNIAMPLRRLLVEMSAKFVYNADVDALVNPTEETERFIEGVTLIFDCLNKLVVELPLYKIYQNKLYHDFKKGFKIMKDYGLKHADIAQEKIKAGEKSEVQGLLEQWLREGRTTEAEALMTSADMFGAGVDTTSNQAAFLLYFMAKNPDVQEKLYQEIKSVLGNRTEPTPEDISKMPYLKGCVMESFRMQSTTETNIRVLAEDTTLMGYHIPAETNVGYLTFIAAKNEKLFPNVDKFDPAQWARDKPNPFAVLPFGFGPRSCYGRRFAELELKLILLQVTREFIVDTELEKIETEYTAVTTRPAGNLPLYLSDRH